jgi:hypothetical protein
MSSVRSRAVLAFSSPRSFARSTFCARSREIYCQRLISNSASHLLIGHLLGTFLRPSVGFGLSIEVAPCRGNHSSYQVCRRAEHRTDLPSAQSSSTLTIERWPC